MVTQDSCRLRLQQLHCRRSSPAAARACRRLSALLPAQQALCVLLGVLGCSVQGLAAPNGVAKANSSGRHGRSIDAPGGGSVVVPKVQLQAAAEVRLDPAHMFSAHVTSFSCMDHL